MTPALKLVRRCAPSEFCKTFPIGSLLWDIIFGIESGIPTCCINEYCFRRHVLKQRNVGLAACPKGVAWEKVDYVPCALHRARYVEELARRATRRNFERRFMY